MPGPCATAPSTPALATIIVIDGNALQSRILTGDGLDTIRISGLKTDQLLIDSGANDDVLKVDGGTRISYVSGEGSDLLQLSRNYFASLLQANNNEQANNEDAPLKAEAPTKQAVEQAFTESVLVEAPSSRLSLRDALKFEDFTTGSGGDSINVDDILRSYGVGLRRESIFADGFLSFEQNGDDSVLVFDADGASKQDKGNTALVVFRGVQASAFSRNNLDSVLINQDDFVLNQQQQQSDEVSGPEGKTSLENPVFQPTLDGQADHRRCSCWARCRNQSKPRQRDGFNRCPSQLHLQQAMPSTVQMEPTKGSPLLIWHCGVQRHR